jgi:hypothetical protein
MKMSGIMDMISSQLDANTLGKIAQQFGGDTQTVQNAVTAAIPAIVVAMKRNASNPQGAEALSRALDKHDGGVLDNLQDMVSGNMGGMMGEGQKILGHLFGAKTETVAVQLGKATGMGNKTGDLLAMLAPMVMGAMGKAKRQTGMGIEDLQNMLGQETASLQKQMPQLSMMEKLLDSDGDGDVDMSDILSRGSSLLGGFFKR